MKLILVAALLLGGCADWTPEQAQAFNSALMVTGASLIVAGSLQPQPVYYAPAALPVVTHCYTYGRNTSCTTY